MKLAQVDPQFWQGKSVFLTGHTGFKGGWLSIWLSSMGAKVTGYALAPNTIPNLYEVFDVPALVEKSHINNIGDFASLKDAMDQSSPDIVIHMAAQPLVRYSYANPIETYTTNVMGTVNVLECVRNLECVKAVVIVTTDKCYENREWDQGYVESDAMGGFDPYSSSKGCAELVTAAYRQSYFSDNANGLKAAIASARAGNVIGGGDWSQDRLVPDAIKAFEENKSLLIRNPNATRPWQHVLEPLSGYLILAQALYEQGRAFSGAWNFGPADQDAVPVKAVIECLIHSWPEKANWQQDGGPHPHEAHFLKLNCNKAKEFLQWAPRWHVNEAIEKIVAWQMAHRQNKSMRAIALEQITQYSQSPSH